MTRALLVLVGVVLLGACGSDTPAAEAVYGSADSTRLEITTGDCNAHPTATVEEADAEVRVLLRANRSWGDAQCADSVVVTLGAPLGNRAVVDEATDERLEVLPAR